MRAYDLSRVSDPELLHDLRELVARDRTTTAALLAHIAEVDSRRLYAPAGYPSMFEYCVRELGLSEQAAKKRIRAGRIARRFPRVFGDVAAGRLHLSALVLLAPHLTPENANDLFGMATGRSKSDIEFLLAERFPRTELLPMLESLPGAATQPVRGHGQTEAPTEDPVGRVAHQVSPGTPGPFHPTTSPDPQIPSRPHKVAPLSPQSFGLHLTIGKSTRDKLCHARALLSHQIPTGDLAQVLDRALDALIGQLEKQKFAATTKPRAARASSSRRHIPAHVKRTVWERDQGRCTFVGESGHRCGTRKHVQFDHVVPVARGGEATVANIRLRCQAHNQLEAEQAFGAGFMDEKRAAARRARDEERAQSDRDVLAALRTLGYRAHEARRAAALCEVIPDASLEERVRRALTYFRPRKHSNMSAMLSAGAP